MSHQHGEFRGSHSHCSPEQKIYHHRKPINGQSSNCLVTRVNSLSLFLCLALNSSMRKRNSSVFKENENDDRVMKTSRC